MHYGSVRYPLRIPVLGMTLLMFFKVFLLNSTVNLQDTNRKKYKMLLSYRFGLPGESPNFQEELASSN